MCLYINRAGPDEPVVGCCCCCCMVMTSAWWEKNKTKTHMIVCPLMICLVWLDVFSRVPLWKWRGSIATRPHTPQRRRAAASINRLSISSALYTAYRPMLMTTAPPPPLPPVQPWLIVSLLLHSVERGGHFSDTVRTVFCSGAFLSTDDVFITRTKTCWKRQGRLEDFVEVGAVWGRHKFIWYH